MTYPASADLPPYLARRLAELRQEYELGQRQLAALETRGTELRATLSRISGAIQVLEEAVAFAGAPDAPPPAPDAGD